VDEPTDLWAADTGNALILINQNPEWSRKLALSGLFQLRKAVVQGIQSPTGSRIV
jgi:hypothetical protein